MGDPEKKYEDVSAESAGTADPTAKFREIEYSDEEVEEIEREREERLEPENRPDNAEVDNTPREFDASKGEFAD